jgi:hypothetical protein
MWSRLQAECLDAGNGCDVLTIPHNSNLGGAFSVIPAMFFDPQDAEAAAQRAAFEPLVEIYQDKGSSECRFDPRFGEGTGTNDELCDFELLEGPTVLQASGVGGGGGAQGTGTFAPSDFDTRAWVRNVLKDGMVLEQQFGVNPFKLGIIASTDSHNGTMGWNPEDETFPGHLGIEDAIPTVGQNTMQNSSGGLAVAWAEENSRDAIFEALKRKETYGTSGTRPIVRFFGSFDFKGNECNGNIPRNGYKSGVPMGADLPDPKKPGSAPSFLVAAWMDDFIGTPLQQVQIIKGWVDANGDTHEQVVTVAGDPNNGATVDQSCGRVGGGDESFCTVWTDPTFDPAEPAFYYVRVLENPVCRYSTHYCQQNYGVNPLSPDCQDQLDGLSEAEQEEAAFCCKNETSIPIVQPVIQERAWTSPIWYKP